MLPPDGQSDRFLTAKVLKLVGCRREKYVFCYVLLSDCKVILSFIPPSSVKQDQSMWNRFGANSFYSSAHINRLITNGLFHSSL